LEAEKMKLLTPTEIQKLSFPDCNIEDMEINIPNKEIKIKTSGAFLSIDNGTQLKSCKITIKNWQSIKLAFYYIGIKRWVNLHIDEIEELTGIAQFEFGEEIIFWGFGSKTDEWNQITISGAFLIVECDYAEDFLNTKEFYCNYQ
jgi:hypothetical protein